MNALLILILLVAGVSLIFNVGYIVHELGLFPHTKDRSSPSDKKFLHLSVYDNDRVETHSFQVLHELNYELRKLGHKEIYNFKSPQDALKKVIRRYQEESSQSRYDDLVHLSNYISNFYSCDDEVNALIDEIADMMIKQPFKS